VRKYRPRGDMSLVDWSPREWSDQIAIDLAVSGARQVLSPAERARAIDILTDQGLNAWNIAERLGCSDRTVYRRWEYHRARRC